MPTAAQLQVVRNVVQVARTFRASGLCSVADLAHLAVTDQESSWDDQAQGDASLGGSYGPYQIFQGAWPNTAQLAVSPWANYAFHLIASHWQSAWDAFGGATAWAQVALRGRFLENFAPKAQGSDPWPAGLGAQRYAEAVAVLEMVS